MFAWRVSELVNAGIAACVAVTKTLLVTVVSSQDRIIRFIVFFFLILSLSIN